MAAPRRTDKKEGDVPTIPSRPATTPDPKVPNPKPTPAAITAPHFAAGLVAEVKQYGSATDPFTGKTVVAADLV